MPEHKWSDDFLSSKFVMGLLAVGIFVFAFIKNPDDKILLGAVIGGFNLALGYFLGSSMAKTPAKTEIVNGENNPVPTTEADSAK